MNTLTNPDVATEPLLGFLGHFDFATFAHVREELNTKQEFSAQILASAAHDESASKKLIPLLGNNTTALDYLTGLLKDEMSGTDPSQFHEHQFRQADLTL